jgi:hypothetical protein
MAEESGAQGMAAGRAKRTYVRPVGQAFLLFLKLDAIRRRSSSSGSESWETLEEYRIYEHIRATMPGVKVSRNRDGARPRLGM